MCTGKGMFTLQSSWMSVHNSFTYWDPSMSAVFLLSDCFDFHIHSLLVASQTELLSMSQVKKQNYFIPLNLYMLSSEMSFFPPEHFWYIQFWNWDSSFQGLALKTNAQCSLIQKGFGVCYIRGLILYFTLKINIHISDEKSQSLHSSR